MKRFVANHLSFQVTCSVRQVFEKHQIVSITTTNPSPSTLLSPTTSKRQLGRLRLQLLLRVAKARAVMLVLLLFLLASLTVWKLSSLVLGFIFSFSFRISANANDSSKCPSDSAGALWLIPRRAEIRKSWSSFEFTIWMMFVCLVIRFAKSIEANLPRHWEGHEFIPGWRKVRIGFRFQDVIGKDLLGLFVLETLYLLLDPAHPHGRHEVGVTLQGRIEMDLLESSLCIVAATGILHLSDELDHRGQRESGEASWREDTILVGNAELGGQELELSLIFLDAGLGNGL